MLKEGKGHSQHRRLKNAEGTIAHLFENKLHNWEGPAYIPQGDMKLAEYHIFGIPHTHDEWKAAIRDHTGLPWFK